MKTIAKTIAKNHRQMETIAKRKLIPSWDRVDNNLALVSKNMGHKRTKGHKRDIKSTRSQLASGLAKFDLAHLDPHVTNVHNHLQYLNNQTNMKRALYPDNFKTSLMWMCNEPGASLLKGAAESAGLFNKPNKEKEELESDLEASFAQGVNFMVDLDEDGSVTTEDTTSWSITTDATVLADLDDFIQSVAA